MIKIFPSLFSGPLLQLQEQIKILEPYCAGFHLDIMDFHFVNNLTAGPDFINAISKACSKQLFVHLMVENLRNWFDILHLKENDIFSFHFESEKNHEHLIDLIHKKNLLASIAISPKTEIINLLPLIQHLDQVLIMSVNPGFSGQIFEQKIIYKIKSLATFKKEKKLNFRIAIDGGINKNNIKEIANLGVNDFAIGSAIFKTENPINAIEELYSLVKN